MKNIYIILSWAILSMFCCGCSNEKEENEMASRVYADFLQHSLNVPSAAGEVIGIVECVGVQWEIVMDANDGMITAISQKQGGSIKEQKRYDQIKISYSENTGLKSRIQEIFLVNKMTGERSVLKIMQTPKYTPVNVVVDTEIRYQYVYGFGGMYNPAIWIASADRISSEELSTMYHKDGLGYNILRLMIYPDEDKWQEDIVGAKQAQEMGAIIFACPWDCTDALADKVEVNGKEVKHLKTSNYAAYAGHLIKYINFMKEHGVNLYAISVQNEPDMSFTYWTPAEIASFVRDYGEQIRATGVKLMSPEACGFLLNIQMLF